MPRWARVTFEGFAPFVVTGLLFGLLYNTLFYPRTPVEYLEAGTIGVLLGGVVGSIEQQPMLRRSLQRLSFARVIALRTVVYSVAVAVCLSLVLSIEPATLGQCAYPACVAQYVGSTLFVRDLVFSMVFVFLSALTAQVVLLVGTRNFGRLLIGRYRRPRELRAELMFVDRAGERRSGPRCAEGRMSSPWRRTGVGPRADPIAPLNPPRTAV